MTLLAVNRGTSATGDTRATPVAGDTMRDRFAGVVAQALDDDPRTVLVLADISAGLFVDAAARHPDRVVNVGIREQLMVSVAGGLALEGMRPVAHSYGSFLLERAFEQVKLDLGHQGVGAVLVSIGASYDWPQGGRTHQSPGDVALLDTLEGWTVHVPGHPDEAEVLLRDAIRGTGRVYVRLSLRQSSSPTTVTPGEMAVLRRGTRATVVAVGPMRDATLDAVADLDVTVLYAATARPFDAATLVATLERPDVVLVEPYLAGTSTHEVAVALAHVPHRVLSLGVGRREVHRYGTPDEHDRLHGLDAASLRTSITRFLGAT